MEIENRLRKRIEKEVEEELQNALSTFHRLIKPEHHTVQIDISKFKYPEIVNLYDLLCHIVSQRKQAVLKHRGDAEIRDFIKKVDSMQSQINDLYDGLEDA
jgi:predicted RNase H-related nuclease YkuK (DUF458 family)